MSVKVFLSLESKEFLNGFSVLILDREKSFYPLPRAVHFDDEVMRVFETIGINLKFDSCKHIHIPLSGGIWIYIYQYTSSKEYKTKHILYDFYVLLLFPTNTRIKINTKLHQQRKKNVCLSKWQAKICLSSL